MDETPTRIPYPTDSVMYRHTSQDLGTDDYLAAMIIRVYNPRKGHVRLKVFGYQNNEFQTEAYYGTANKQWIFAEDYKASVEKDE
jgi:hypothetical protein